MNQRQILARTCNQFKKVGIAFMSEDKNGNPTKIFKRNGVTWNNIIEEFDETDYDKYEIYTGVVFKDDCVLFVYDIDAHSTGIDWNNMNDAVKAINSVLEPARRIENRYPGLLSWKFTGRGLHGLAIIRPHNGADEKFGSIFKFYKEFKRYLDSVSECFGDPQFINPNGMNRCMGSINLKSNLYTIPININWSAKDIYLKSKKCFIDVDYIKRPFVNVEFWYKILTPKKTEVIEVDMSKKLEINYDLYPPCILNMLSKKEISNINRFKLIAFFKFIHDEKQIKEIFEQNLTPDKYYLISEGNDKDQISHVLNNNEIKPPICAFYGKYCTNCGKKNPLEGIVTIKK